MPGKIKILIVDDEVRFLKTLSQRLSLRDFDVTSASNGLDAIEAAQNGEFDLALVDLKMPGMDGERVLELLKQKDPFIEVVILTGHGSLESAISCSKLGSHGYLPKPCETFELLQVLKDAYKTRVRKKMKLNDAQIDTLSKNGPAEDNLHILKILKKIEDGAG